MTHQPGEQKIALVILSGLFFLAVLLTLRDYLCRAWAGQGF